jgi:hypothetical protein
VIRRAASSTPVAAIGGGAECTLGHPTIVDEAPSESAASRKVVAIEVQRTAAAEVTTIHGRCY